MALLKAPNKQPKTTTLQVRLEDGVRRNLDNYAAFIDASPSYVVSEALKLLFRKDAEFKRWADEHSNHDHAQQLEQGLSSDGRSTYERATPASRKDASTTDTSLKLSSVPGFKPKFHKIPEIILLIRGGIAQDSLSGYWERLDQFIGLGLHRRRLRHLLEGHTRRLLLRLP